MYCALVKILRGRKVHLRWMRGNATNKCDVSKVVMRHEILMGLVASRNQPHCGDRTTSLTVA